MIELFTETQAAPKQDLQSVFKKCLDAVEGRDKSSGSQWEDWMHDVFQDIHPQCTDEVLPKLIKAGFLNSEEDQALSAKKLANFVLLASRASYEKKWACFIEPESEEKASKNDTYKFILSLFKISLDLLKFLHQSGYLKNKLVSDFSYGELTR